MTDGATAPPVDDSPSATTSTAPEAEPTETEEEDAVAETDEPDAAALVGPVGIVGAAVLALNLAMLL